MELEQRVFPLGEGLYRLVQTDDRGTFVDSYLILGSRSALLVDLQRDRGALLETVRSLTDLPLSAVVTHAHADHLGENAPAFLEAGIPLWIFPEELSLLPAGGPLDPGAFRALRDGMRFDLGGAVLEVGSVTGHTPRGCMLLEREKGLLFSGDALGNRSFWMLVPGAAPLGVFLESLRRYLSAARLPEALRVLVGHGIGLETEDGGYPGRVAAETERILRGEAVGEEVEHRFGPCRCLRTPLFPEGYFYRRDRL